MATLTKAEMCSKLKAIGLTRNYKPFNDPSNVDRAPGREVILLEQRKPARIVDGLLVGSEMDIYDESTVRVWTSQKKKANALARANGFKQRLLDGEAEILIPIAKADLFLHALGAKVKMARSFTPEQRAAVAARFAKVKQDRKVLVAA